VDDVSEAAFKSVEPVEPVEPEPAEQDPGEPAVTDEASPHDATDEPVAAVVPEAAEPAEATPALPRKLDPRPKTPQASPATRRPPGVTGRGVVVLIFVATLVGGLLDMMISGHRGHMFGVVFAVASALGALGVRRRDLRTAMVAPPLVYCVLIGVMSLIDQGGLSGGLATREAFYLGNAFVTGAPAIWVGTALACGIGWYRLRKPR
jgi:hypothetical protein